MDIINNKIKLYQYDEKYLIDNIKYYNSNVCLEYQNNLSPYFCFRYLYNNITEPIKYRVYYNNIIEYFKNNSEYNKNTSEFYVKIFDICMYDRLNDKNKLNVIKIQNTNKSDNDNQSDNDNDNIKPLFFCDSKCYACNDKFCYF